MHRLSQQAKTFEFGINEDDYIRDQLIDRCYLSHLCWKFLEKKGTVMLDDLLWVVRSQEAADLQLKQYNTDQGDQLKAESGKVDANRNPRKMKTCFSCGPEGHLSQGKWCLVQGQACIKCGAIGHFKVKWPQLYQQSGAQERGVAEVDTKGLAEVQVDLVKVDIDVKD